MVMIDPSRLAAQVHNPDTTLDPALSVIDTELGEVSGIKQGIDREADVLRKSHKQLKEKINVASEALKQEKVTGRLSLRPTFFNALPRLGMGLVWF